MFYSQTCPNARPAKGGIIMNSLLHRLTLGFTGGILAAMASAAELPTRMSAADVFLQTLKPSGETPRMADGKPDFSGTLGGFPASIQAGRRSNLALEPDARTVGRAGAALNPPPYKPEFWKQVENLNFGRVDEDPSVHCVPAGLPRSGAPESILMTPTVMWAEYSDFGGGHLRQIPIGTRKLTEADDDESTYMGVSVAHWEGDTLVVESTGFTDNSWLGVMGWFHTNRMKVTERFRRNGNLIYWDATVTDPAVLSQPWVMTTSVYRINQNANARFLESSPCREQDMEHINASDPYYR